jgi:hypothetical protein
MKITNIATLKAFLDKNIKGYYDLDKVLKDIEENYMETATLSYELKSYETKSGRPETISYEVETTYLVDGEWMSEQEYFERDLEEFDDYELEFIF